MSSKRAQRHFLFCGDTAQVPFARATRPLQVIFANGVQPWGGWAVTPVASGGVNAVALGVKAGQAAPITTRAAALPQRRRAGHLLPAHGHLAAPLLPIISPVVSLVHAHILRQARQAPHTSCTFCSPPSYPPFAPSRSRASPSPPPHSNPRPPLPPSSLLIYRRATIVKMGFLVAGLDFFVAIMRLFRIIL